MDRSLRSDQTNGLVGRYVATDSNADRSVRSDRPARSRVNLYVVTLFESFSDVPCCDLGLRVFSFDESTEISARFYCKFLRKDLFTKISFRKKVHADFYGDFQTLIPS
ncbi:hypothetical protein F2Q69_00053464 [Brassica cretica]|uniref:Uncharacterized protein n=1 Tax=Brassica cretica TaxID=69181 RepID=A0A8S9MXX3_BRACR|nr:hypothetical protein F2Q69_00053464 [Brassica cretica]